MIEEHDINYQAIQICRRLIEAWPEMKDLNELSPIIYDAAAVVQAQDVATSHANN